MKVFRPILSLLLVLLLLVPTLPAFAATDSSENGNQRIVNNSIIIDDDATGGYEGDYVVIYNPATSSSTSYSTGTMTGLIETTIEPNVSPFHIQNASAPDERPYKIDIDGKLRELAESTEPGPEPEPVRASYNVGSTKSFTLVNVNTGGTYSLQFECLYVGSHCYIWTPTSTTGTYYPLDEIDSSYAKLAADEFDSKFDLMQSSFGNHTNGSSGDGKLHMLYYNIDDGWNGSGGYIAGFFYQGDISNNGLPILNIDTYPGVYYKNPNSGNVYKRMDDTYNTMVHEYQHLINYSNTSRMSSWLNECFSAAAEEICYPGSSVVDRIQSWEEYYYYENEDWLNPPKEFMYDSANSLHTGFSMYNWNDNLDSDAILALYAQVSFFAQYLFTRFGNSIYRQISNKYSSSETTAITNATGVSCTDLVRDFRVAVTANAAQSQYNGIYGFKVQDGYDPSKFDNVENPWSLLGPVIFTGSSCSIKGGGAITVKPKNGVYNPPSGANSNLKYIGIKLASTYTVTAVSNNTAWGTVSVDGIRITATPATGYYVSGYEVVSGTATATISGNIITVSPESDCTIRVIFAPKASYTVNFVASGSSEGSETAFDGDAITLPSSVSVNPDGWTFSGWTDTEIPDETTEIPGYIAPGGSYTVTADATLYALYTRVEEGAGEVGYELVSNAPTDWTGNYVITYGTDINMYVMTGVTPSSNGARIESASNATTYANAGVSLSGSVLSNVANSYIFKLAKHGSYYSIQSASTNAYVGEDSSSYLAGYTSYASGYCDWTPGALDNASSATNAKNGDYPLLGFNNGSNYFWSGSTTSGASAAKKVRFWRENSGDLTYYTTDPVVIVAAPAFKTHALALEGKIGIYFFLDLPQNAVYKYEGVNFTIGSVDGAPAFV
ncbi:MAG: InlB B-repeat-containing protein, partial [Clostridia bacterium]|nr:InlB B-repeat-containing protein [Clostridia bacterium]